MVEVVAGRTYRISDGEFTEFGEAKGPTDNGHYEIAGWYVDAKGGVLGSDIVAEEVPEPESTEDRHAADEQDMQHDGLPRLHERRLAVRQLHALERIADALDVLTCVAMDAQEHAAGGHDADEDADEDAADGESVQ